MNDTLTELWFILRHGHRPKYIFQTYLDVFSTLNVFSTWILIGTKVETYCTDTIPLIVPTHDFRYNLPIGHLEFLVPEVAFTDHNYHFKYALDKESGVLTS